MISTALERTRFIYSEFDSIFSNIKQATFFLYIKVQRLGFLADKSRFSLNLIRMTAEIFRVVQCAPISHCSFVRARLSLKGDHSQLVDHALANNIGGALVGGIKQHQFSSKENI